MSNAQYTDPGDTRFYLEENGWISLRFDDADLPKEEYYSRVIEEANERLHVVIQLTPSGRRKFFIEDPPETFVEAAHDGECLVDLDTVENAEIYQLHFSRAPDSVVDGIRTIREMLHPDP